MKRTGFHLFVAVALFTQTGCFLLSHATIVGSGVPLTETRDVADFAELDVSGAIRADVSYGEPKVEVTTDDNILPYVVTESRNGCLRVYVDVEGRVAVQEPISVVITTPSLDVVEVSGACSVAVSDIEVDQFDVELSGASNLLLAGTCQQLVAEVSGMCQLAAEPLDAESVSMDVSGASKVFVRVTEKLQGDVSGACHIEYYGQPERIDIDSSGVSKVIAND